MSDFGYTYKGLLQWVQVQPRTSEELYKARLECNEKVRDMNTTNTVVIEVMRCLDVLRVLEAIAWMEQVWTDETGFSSEEESDDEEDPIVEVA